MNETPAKLVCHAPIAVWSSDYPKVAGLYWVRYHGQRRELTELTGNPGNLKQAFYGEPVGLHNLPKEWGWQWAGPIPEPQVTLKEPTAPAMNSSIADWEAAVTAQRDIMETFLLEGQYAAARARCVALKSWEQTLNALKAGCRNEI